MSPQLKRACMALAVALIATNLEAQRTVKLPERPAPQPARPFKYPAFTVDSLPNGLRFAIIENHELPLVATRVMFEGSGPLGLWFVDAPGKEGAWGLLLMSLADGTPTRTGSQIRDEIADLGIDFTTTSAGSFVPPWFRAPKSTWRPALNLFGDLLMNATVPADAFTRVQANAVVNDERAPPITTANRLMFAALYGQTSAYSRFATAATIRGLNREDLLAAKRAYMGPQNATIVIAGDISRAEARKAVQETFGNWQRSEKTVEPVARATALQTPTTIYLKDAPGMRVAQIVTGQVVPGRENPDAAAISALGAMLGSAAASAGSRVYRAFRTERGLAYSPAVELFARPVPETAPLSGRLTVADTAVDVAVQTYLRVIRELKETKPVTESELEFSRQNLVSRLPMTIETLENITNVTFNTIRDRLTPGYLNDWAQRIAGLSIPEVQAAAAKYLDPDHTAVVVIGDRSKIEERLRATGIPVVIIDK